MDRLRLYRSTDNRVIAGVAGGLAEYFHLDPSLVRLLWILVIFLGGAGLLVYLIAWAVIPSQERVFPQSFPEQSTTGMPSGSRSEGHPLKNRPTFLIGVVLVGLGLFFLGVEVFSIDLHKYFWPVILIGGGALLLFGTGRSRRK